MTRIDPATRRVDEDDRHRRPRHRPRGRCRRRLGRDRRLRHRSCSIDPGPGCRDGHDRARRSGQSGRAGRIRDRRDARPGLGRRLRRPRRHRSRIRQAQANRIDLGRAAALQMAAGYGAVWATTFAQPRKARRGELGAGDDRVLCGHVRRRHRPRPVGRVGGARAAAGQLWKLDPVTGASQRHRERRYGHKRNCPRLPAPSGSPRGDSHTLLRLDPSTGTVLAAIPMGGTPEDVAVGGGLVWVAVQADGRRRLEPEPLPERAARPRRSARARCVELGAQRGGYLGADAAERGAAVARA